MLLQIRHLTQYRYAAPVRESVMELWMQPQKTSRQRLINFDLSIDPAAQTFNHVDVYGNVVHHFDIPQSHDLLTIRASATVENRARPTASVYWPRSRGATSRLRYWITD